MIFIIVDFEANLLESVSDGIRCNLLFVSDSNGLIEEMWSFKAGIFKSSLNVDLTMKMPLGEWRLPTTKCHAFSTMAQK